MEGKHSNEAIKDQVRKYHISVQILAPGGDIMETIDAGTFDNYQLEGEMNQDRDYAKAKLLEAGYNDEEAEKYLDALPSRTIDEIIPISNENREKYGQALINQQIAAKRFALGIKETGTWR